MLQRITLMGFQRVGRNFRNIADSGTNRPENLFSVMAATGVVCVLAGRWHDALVQSKLIPAFIYIK